MPTRTFIAKAICEELLYYSFGAYGHRTNSHRLKSHDGESGANQEDREEYLRPTHAYDVIRPFQQTTGMMYIGNRDPLIMASDKPST